MNLDELASQLAQLSDSQLGALLTKRAELRGAKRRAQSAARSSRYRHATVTPESGDFTLERHATVTQSSRRPISSSPALSSSPPEPSSPPLPTLSSSVLPPGASLPGVGEILKEQTVAVFIALGGAEQDAEAWLAEGGDPSGGPSKIRPRAKKFLAKAKAAKHVPDPRFSAVTDGYTSAFAEIFNAPYVHQGAKDGKALSELLKVTPQTDTAEAIVQMMRDAMRRSFEKFARACKNATTLFGFCSCVNEIRAELARYGSSDVFIPIPRSPSRPGSGVNPMGMFERVRAQEREKAERAAAEADAIEQLSRRSRCAA